MTPSRMKDGSGDSVASTRPAVTAGGVSRPASGSPGPPWAAPAPPPVLAEAFDGIFFGGVRIARELRRGQRRRRLAIVLRGEGRSLCLDRRWVRPRDLVSVGQRRPPDGGGEDRESEREQ